MTTFIKFDLKELKKLANDKNSCVVEKKVVQNLALQPWCLRNVKESIKNLLDYKIGKFDKEYNGILLSYKNLQVLQNVGAIRNDNADIHFQVQADYFIFQPYIGATLKGVVNKKSNTHLGILVHRVFNVVIPRPTEEPGNDWIGASVEEGQEVVFQIVVLDLFGALPYIRGKLDERWLELEVNDDDTEESKANKVINVSYINFDKTKPEANNSKPSEDPPSTKKRTSTCSVIEDVNDTNVTSTSDIENIASTPPKKKTKRESTAEKEHKSKSKKRRKETD
ncbi:DNA-directed RNA polymerase I subunit RPA43 [Aricia agestis]|uniref:DNA-directed RNA polymerase I subunit RPA43 n=1 Tax=Aricia agestis TaxID=91739 RepID=UPI001C202E51|nr:DNA-directed RNA polymerase I subunit RPA43 [Aricia agestis]